MPKLLNFNTTSLGTILANALMFLLIGGGIGGIGLHGIRLHENNRSSAKIAG